MGPGADGPALRIHVGRGQLVRRPLDRQAAIPGTYNYTPISGQRDALGLIRIDDPSVPNTGYGKYPFFDIGAYEYVNLHPPEVTGVTATIAPGSTPVNFYAVGGKSGANQTPQYIDVTFNGPIDPSTLNASTVELEALGVTGNNAPGTLISLAGKISYDSATDTLVISLGASGLTLKTDAYQLILIGSGSQVITNQQGIALDGENLSNDDDPATGVQLPLPSGNGLPGGNFYDNFIINTTPPIVTSGTFMLAPSQRYQQRSGRHLGDPAKLRRHDHRAQHRAGASRRPDCRP